MIVGYISLIVMTILFGLWVNKSPFFSLDSLSKKFTYLALFLKISAGTVLWLVYTYYYTDRANSDIYKYFDDAVHLFNSTQSDWASRIQLIFGFQNDGEIAKLLANTNFWDSSKELFFNDNRTMIRIHMVLLHLSGGVYLFHVLFFSLISFIGSVGLFHFFKNSTKLPNWILFVCCFCVPSVLFWASAPLKESLTIFGLGLFLAGGQQILQKRNSFYSYIFCFIGLIALISVKIYILFALLPGLWFYVTTQNKSKRTVTLKFIWLHSLFVVFLFSNKVIAALALKQSQFKFLIEKSGANSAIEISSFDSFFSLISTLPQAVFNVLIRPIYPPQLGLFSLFAAAEHLLFLAILIAPFVYKKSIGLSEQRTVMFCISFVLICSGLIGLTVPVLGGIVRYKVPFIPFYLIAILTFINFSKIPSKLK